ncbi:FxsA family protein [Actinocorallia longicatena]|uniref:Uncharacterized protein n=1 Tax=Actinocorallia longicatena TaxID=111803 RepID=A0ABP6Q5S6_9ACTN
MAVFLFVAFLALPILEIYVIIQVGQVIGGWETVFLLLVESLLGAWIVKREGRRAWRNLNSSLQSGRMPDRELADAALVLVGGVLLLTPGFVSDFFGFLCILPFTRPLVRGALLGWAARKIKVTAPPMMFPEGFARTQPGPDGAPVVRGEVIHGEVVDDDRKGT